MLSVLISVRLKRWGVGEGGLGSRASLAHPSIQLRWAPPCRGTLGERLGAPGERLGALGERLGVPGALEVGF